MQNIPASNNSFFVGVGSVLTPYYSEETVYSRSDLEMENEDGISVIFYLQKIFPGFAFYMSLIMLYT